MMKLRTFLAAGCALALGCVQPAANAQAVEDGDQSAIEWTRAKLDEVRGQFRDGDYAEECMVVANTKVMVLQAATDMGAGNYYEDVAYASDLNKQFTDIATLYRLLSLLELYPDMDSEQAADRVEADMQSIAELALSRASLIAKPIAREFILGSSTGRFDALVDRFASCRDMLPAPQ